MTSTNLDRYGSTLSVGECAEVLGVSVPTVYRQCRAGAVPCLRIGGRVRVPKRLLELYLAGQWPVESPGDLRALTAGAGVPAETTGRQ